MTPEQQAKLDEEKKLEEERLAREKGDNARERALDMMMGGVLEIKKEDELKKVIYIMILLAFTCTLKKKCTKLKRAYRPV